MLRDIPATQQEIARYLGISTRTLRRYITEDQAPRAVLLALFWRTRWGISEIETRAQNEAARWFMQAKALERQIARLQAKIERLEALGSFGSANEPLFA